MKNQQQSLTSIFDRIVLNRPGVVLGLILVVVCFLAYQMRHFKLDASAETLVLENDKDLQYSRLIKSRYVEYESLIITFTPQDDLFSDQTLKTLTRFRDELRESDGVASVASILDVPLLESPPVPLKELSSNIQSLESLTVNRALAKEEFAKSPLYQNLLVSPDLKTTALQVNFPVNAVYRDLLDQRYHLRKKQSDGSLTTAELLALKNLNRQLERHRDEMNKKWHQQIAAVRAVMEKYRQDAELFLGGVSMIADDMIAFIKNDLKVFGVGIFVFLVVTLGVIFRKMRWIVLPMTCCAFSVVCMIGLLSLFGWQVTVISSNFISLQLIITMAVIIHLIVRYRELSAMNPMVEQRRLVLNTVRLMFVPCLYTSLTTIAGFGSLLLCNIRPVISFGWMMIAGLIVSFTLSFLLFPAGLMLVGKSRAPKWRSTSYSFPAVLGRFTAGHGKLITVFGGVLLIFSIIGISRLEVENSFINYFKDTTEIYRGMKTIDQCLGGTTPLDVIVDMAEGTSPEPPKSAQNMAVDDFNDFHEFDDAEAEEKYWFTSEKMALVVKIHDYLDRLPETGKVMSLGTMMKVAERLTDGKPLDNFELALLYSELPAQVKTMAITPYVSIEHDQVRFSVRIKDSEKTLKRNQLLKNIRHTLTSEIGINEQNIRFAGLFVLYNNMLQNLFRSQILTLGVTALVLMLMFLVLFRSLKIALIAISPNLLSVGAVLGFMGWMNIPLDMMTITIAAISVGIAVDNTIHYIHRFRNEFPTDHNYIETLYRSHGSIGHAMYYTSITIIVGFSILCLSNFIPSIYFGLLTGLAMLIALLAAMTLLPRLLVLVKPFGPNAG